MKSERGEGVPQRVDDAVIETVFDYPLRIDVETAFPPEFSNIARAGIVKADELASADPAQVTRLLRPCMLWLAASPDHSGPS